jgi:LCP family protein required for cell wall assembly
MTRSATIVTVLLLGAAVLSACNAGADDSAQVAPTVYYVPATYVPPGMLSDEPLHSDATAVLLLGADRRSAAGSVDNTDTMMLLCLDPVGQQIVVLSIPRDLYVDIPGHGHGRINTAYAWGEQDGTGGLELARQAVSAALGFPVQHAALLDFQAFVTVVDAVGGVDVDVPYAISDPTYPDGGTGHDPFYLSAGQHHLDGGLALKYARTRATPGGDFSRGSRQRQVVLAVRDRVTNLDLLPSLVSQSPQLWSTLKSSFETDLTLGEIVELAIASSRIPGDRIKMAAIDLDCAHEAITATGAYVLLPDRIAIAALISDLFSGPETSASAR